MLNSKSLIGVQMLIVLSEGQKTGAELAEILKIHVAYVERISKPLRDAGLIETLRGNGGGYSITRPLDDIQVTEVTDVLYEKPMRRNADKIDELIERVQGRLKGITLAELM